MPLMQSEWAAAGAPGDRGFCVNVQLTVAKHQGQALVASCLPPVAGRQSQSQSQSPSASRQSQSQSPITYHQPPAASRQGPSRPRVADRQPQAASRRPPVASRREPAECPGPRTRQAAEARASSVFAEDDELRAIARFRPFVRVAAVSATIREPESPDHYGLRRHLAEAPRGLPQRRALDARQTRSPEGRPRQLEKSDARR